MGDLHKNHTISYQKVEIPNVINDSTGKYVYLTISENKKDEFLNALINAYENQ